MTYLALSLAPQRSSRFIASALLRIQNALLCFKLGPRGSLLRLHTARSSSASAHAAAQEQQRCDSHAQLRA